MRMRISWLIISAFVGIGCSGKEDNAAPNNVASNNVTSNNVASNNVASNNVASNSGQGCAGLAEGEARCAGADQEICLRGGLTTRPCAAGRTCDAAQATCECDGAADGLCPDGCGDDPDCVNCTPDCGGNTCGSDSCGGTCGSCAATETCQDGSCVDVTGVCGNTCGPPEQPGGWADDGECDDGGDGGEAYCEYGTDCGDCGPREALPVRCTINYNGDCAANERCDCDEATGSCVCAEGTRGTGAFGSACVAQHDCASGLCLDDQCSQSCEDGGDCMAPMPVCQPILGLCVGGTCTPDCTGRACGDDGCGGSCGACAGGEVCSSGQCVAGGQNAIDCPYLSTGGCATGQSCCVSQGNASACFDLGSPKDQACKTEADSYGYLYIGCEEDADCPGQKCCADNHKSFCGDTCQTPVCTRGMPGSCDVGYVCCAFQPTTLFFTTDPRDEGYCFPTTCP